jgi:CheY-like chemotaxis protein
MDSVMLCIDDNEDNIFLLKRLFKRSWPDIQLHTAMTGRDGIRAAIDDQPALILLDNRLPDINGEEVLRELAATPATAGIPVVILSGDSDPATVDELLAAGAADYLVKPFDIHRFTAIIGRYVRLDALIYFPGRRCVPSRTCCGHGDQVLPGERSFPVGSQVNTGRSGKRI